MLPFFMDHYQLDDRSLFFSRWPGVKQIGERYRVRPPIQQGRTEGRRLKVLTLMGTTMSRNAITPGLWLLSGLNRTHQSEFPWTDAVPFA
jgi:hypothetical protein